MRGIEAGEWRTVVTNEYDLKSNDHIYNGVVLEVRENSLVLREEGVYGDWTLMWAVVLDIW